MTAAHAFTAEPPAHEFPQSLNLYAYARNNPVTNVDPDGHCWPWCTAAIGAGIGAVVGGGSEYIQEALTNGTIFTWNGSTITHAAIGGAITGAAIGIAGPEAGAALELGESAAAALSTGAAVAGSVAGGATERVLNGERAGDVGAVATDAISGLAGVKVEALVRATIATTGIREGATDLIDTATGSAQRGIGTGAPSPTNKRTCKEQTPCGSSSNSPKTPQPVQPSGAGGSQ